MPWLWGGLVYQGLQAWASLPVLAPPVPFTCNKQRQLLLQHQLRPSQARQDQAPGSHTLSHTPSHSPYHTPLT